MIIMRAVAVREAAEIVHVPMSKNEMMPLYVCCTCACRAKYGGETVRKSAVNRAAAPDSPARDSGSM